jgi:hypothetical protein
MLFGAPPKLKASKFIWVPPLAAALPAMEELRKAHIKRQHSTHVFVCPRSMTPLWQKQLYKAADIVIVVPSCHPAWSLAMFEPLLIGIAFPFVLMWCGLCYTSDTEFHFHIHELERKVGPEAAGDKNRMSNP